MFKGKLKYLWFLLLLISSCVGEDFIEVDPTQRPRVVIYGASASLDSLLINSSKQYSAAFFNEYGIQGDGAISWSSQNPTIATVDGNGNVQGIKRGVTNITATSSGRSASQSIQIYSIERVEVNAPKTYVFLNDSLQFTATYYDENNQIQNASFSWASSINAVASARSDGRVFGNLKGQSIITATANGIESDPFLLNVIDDSNAVASVVILNDTNKLFKNEQYQFEAEVLNGFGVKINSPISWSSSDSTVLAISNTGLASAIAQGVASITATSDGVNSTPLQLVVLEGANGRRSGSFQNENGYSVSGSVEMRPGSGNNFELSFSNFNCQPGPALYIYLGNSTTAGIEIEELKQLTGDFIVPLPTNIQLNDYQYVLIWCKSANAAFGSARLN